MSMDLEYRIGRMVKSSIGYFSKVYDYSYRNHPRITNYLSSATGTVRGDVIAKQFTENPDVKLRDIAFTASAAIVYSYLAPKMIEWSTRLTDTISVYRANLKDSKLAHDIFNSCVLTAMYFPVNMLYWDYLSLKNEASISIESNLLGAATLCIASIPYLYADYVAIKKFSQPETKKYLRPFYSAIEIAWNTLFAGGNYLAKRL